MSSRRRLFDGIGPSEDTNFGLWLDRFPLELSQEASAEFRAFALRGIKVPEDYRVSFEARNRALARYDGGVEGGVTNTFIAEALSRLAVGLGTASVLETGLTLNWTWGVPMIPGSALKGIASQAAHATGDARWAKARSATEPGGELHCQLFGGLDAAGLVTFHDAWWSCPAASRGLPIDLDTMTVHHKEYYSGKDQGPMDWDEPNPVSFLTTSGSYSVSLSGPADWLDLAARFLKVGLEREGVGAKTAAGYGRLHLEVPEALAPKTTGGAPKADGTASPSKSESAPASRSTGMAWIEGERVEGALGDGRKLGGKKLKKLKASQAVLDALAKSHPNSPVAVWFELQADGPSKLQILQIHLVE
ncbi:MAG: type III-B CRISPR module RAMP protein Cmr6 [Deltaproteobacteria bacterium]|nr:type III-B CRISPR module RAMP protein Cmr6 [Deltaproteobacteria bacterium]